MCNLQILLDHIGPVDFFNLFSFGEEKHSDIPLMCYVYMLTMNRKTRVAGDTEHGLREFNNVVLEYACVRTHQEL